MLSLLRMTQFTSHTWDSTITRVNVSCSRCPPGKTWLMWVDTGMPQEWQKILDDNGITRAEQEENPDKVRIPNVVVYV